LADFLARKDLADILLEALLDFLAVGFAYSVYNILSYPKGSVKWKKRGGLSGINRWAFNMSTFPQILYRFLKDPGPLNHKKRISAA
jgi:hypothetical protein